MLTHNWNTSVLRIIDWTLQRKEGVWLDMNLFTSHGFLDLQTPPVTRSIIFRVNATTPRHPNTSWVGVKEPLFTSPEKALRGFQTPQGPYVEDFGCPWYYWFFIHKHLAKQLRMDEHMEQTSPLAMSCKGEVTGPKGIQRIHHQSFYPPKLCNVPTKTLNVWSI